MLIVLPQGFRSPPGPNAGILDAEFEAFQAGYLPGGGLYQSPFHDGTSAHFATSPPIQQELPGWASGFQRLNLNEVRSSPISPSQFRHEAPLQRITPGGWHQEFLHQQNVSVDQQSYVQQRYHGMGWQQRQSQLPQFYNLDPQLSSIPQQKEPEPAVEDAFDEAAFEKAFDAAKMEIMDAETQGMDSRAELGQTISAYARTLETQEDVQNYSPNYGESVMRENQDLLDQVDFDAFLQEPTNLGQTSTEATDDKSEVRREVDADELAKTAGQLLDSLKHEQSQKFQQSNFLALMRQLRDKEVRVEGDKMVDVKFDVSILSFSSIFKPSHVGSAEVITCQIMQCEALSS